MATLTVASTKAEEIKALRDFAAKCAEGSYLGQLLTEAFLIDLERRIDADWGCDYYADLAEAERQQQAAEAHAAELDARCKELIANLDAERAEHAGAIEEWRGRLDAEHRAEEKVTEQYWAMRDERDMARGQLRAAQQVVIELKAKLYDLLIAGEEEQDGEFEEK